MPLNIVSSVWIYFYLAITVTSKVCAIISSKQFVAVGIPNIAYAPYVERILRVGQAQIECSGLCASDRTICHGFNFVKTSVPDGHASCQLFSLGFNTTGIAVARSLVYLKLQTRDENGRLDNMYHEQHIIPPITYYWTGLLMLDHSNLVGILTNSKITETKALEPQKSWHFCTSIFWTC